MEPSVPPDDLVRLHDLVTLTGLSRKWLREEALAGRLPCLNADGKLRFNLAAVRKALAERAAGFGDRGAAHAS